MEQNVYLLILVTLATGLRTERKAKLQSYFLADSSLAIAFPEILEEVKVSLEKR